MLLQLAAQKSQAVMLAAKQARIAIQHQPASTSPAPSQAMPSPAVPAPGQNGIPWQLLKRYTPATHPQVLHQWQQAQFAAAASVVQQASSQPGTVHGVQSAPAGRPTITTALAPPSLPSSIPSGSSQQAGPTPPGAGIASRGPLLATGYPVGPHQSRAGPAGERHQDTPSCINLCCRPCCCAKPAAEDCMLHHNAAGTCLQGCACLLNADAMTARIACPMQKLRCIQRRHAPD